MVEILDLSYRKPRTQRSGYPFLTVNCVFRFPDCPDKESLKSKALSLALPTYRTLANESKERLLQGEWKWVWTFGEPEWKYLEKFDTFWFRQWVSDCSVTRAVLSELRYFQHYGKLPSVYRQLDAGVILRHIETLGRYWD